MPTEDDFLRKVHENLAEDTTRLVYADWLDEQGDGPSKTKADFIRLEICMAAIPERSLNHIRFAKHRQKLAAALDSEWLAVISHPRLERCWVEFEFECPKRWSNLIPTDQPQERFCDTCRRSVYYCATISAARAHAVAGHCVAVSLALVRRPDDLAPTHNLLPGPVRLTPEMIARLGHPRVSPPLTSPAAPSPAAEPTLPEWEDGRPRIQSKKPRKPRRDGRRFRDEPDEEFDD
jgi:uncharacterized protein (TIGR02996 family)